MTDRRLQHIFFFRDEWNQLLVFMAAVAFLIALPVALVKSQMIYLIPTALALLALSLLLRRQWHLSGRHVETAIDLIHNHPTVFGELHIFETYVALQTPNHRDIVQLHLAFNTRQELLEHIRKSDGVIACHFDREHKNVLIEWKDDHFPGELMDAETIRSTMTKNRRSHRQWILFLAAVLTLILAINTYTIYPVLSNLRCAGDDVPWTIVNAEIVQSRLEETMIPQKHGKDQQGWVNQITYRYEYDGHTYESTRIACAYLPLKTRTDALTLQRRFVPGGRVHAKVDPEDPEKAVLMEIPADALRQRLEAILDTCWMNMIMLLILASTSIHSPLRRNRELARLAREAGYSIPKAAFT